MDDDAAATTKVARTSLGISASIAARRVARDDVPPAAPATGAGASAGAGAAAAAAAGKAFVYNAAQKQLFSLALAACKPLHNVMLLGPPQSGMTVTLVALLQMFRARKPRHAVWVLAPNDAVVQDLATHDVQATTIAKFMGLERDHERAHTQEEIASLALVVRARLQRSSSRHPLLTKTPANLTLVLFQGTAIKGHTFRIMMRLLQAFGDAKQMGGGFQLLLLGDVSAWHDGDAMHAHVELLAFPNVIVQPLAAGRGGCEPFRDALRHAVAGEPQPPSILKAMAQYVRPATAAAVARDNMRTNTPIVAPTVVMARAINFATLQKLQQAHPEAGVAQLKIAHGVVCSSKDERLLAKLRAIEQALVMYVHKQLTTARVVQFSLLRVTHHACGLARSKLVRVVAIRPPQRAPPSGQTVDAAFQAEVAQAVQSGRRMFLSAVLPRIMVQAAAGGGGGGPAAAQVPIVIAAMGLPQHVMDTVLRSLPTFDGSDSAAHFEKHAKRMNPDGSDYPRAYVAYTPVVLGNALALERMQTAKVQFGVCIGDLEADTWPVDVAWRVGLRHRDLVLARLPSDSAWARLLSLPRDVQEFLAGLFAVDTAPAICLHDVRCEFTTCSALSDGSRLLRMTTRVMELYRHTLSSITAGKRSAANASSSSVSVSSSSSSSSSAALTALPALPAPPPPRRARSAHPRSVASSSSSSSSSSSLLVGNRPVASDTSSIAVSASHTSMPAPRLKNPSAVWRRRPPAPPPAAVAAAEGGGGDDDAVMS